MKMLTKLGLSVLSGLLLTLGWPEHGFPLLLFVGFVPLLLIEEEHYNKGNEKAVLGLSPYTFLTFSIWNIFTSYWIYNAAFVGVVAAVLLNTMLMSGAFLMFHFTRRVLKNSFSAYFSLVAYWLSYELLHLTWDLNWPWLNLGNGFAAYPRWIQWYEYTGIFGGSLWVLLVNILVFQFINLRVVQKICSRGVGIRLVGAILLVLIPIIFSNYTYTLYKEKLNAVNVVVVQPNIDPYHEQYETDPSTVTRKMLDMAAQKSDSLTDFIVFPESAIQEYADEDFLTGARSVRQVRDFVSRYPHMGAVVGISTRKIFKPGEPLTLTARKFSDTAIYYDSYNTALLINRTEDLQKHHKSKLTPGVEKMPYPGTFRFLEKYALDLGGTIGSLGTDNFEHPFRINSNVEVAPIICYESVYGDYVRQFVRNGATLIFVITNDGWWGNTPGHRQHLLFSALRAIETRRSVARSANTGVSCFISQRGDISQRTSYWKPDVISASINTNAEITFYVKYGDYIGWFFAYMAGLLAILAIGIRLFIKLKNPVSR